MRNYVTHMENSPIRWSPQQEQLRVSLCNLQRFIRDAVIQSRDDAKVMTEVAEETEADTIYGIDKVGEESLKWWFSNHWPQNEPVQLVMEGLSDQQLLTFPEGLTVEQTKWKCILDPIDGSRGFMYDKRPAWILSGIAPQKGNDTNLQDIEVAVMTEIPTSKQGLCDQISTVRGYGPAGIIADRFNRYKKEVKPIQLHPSRAVDFEHGFAALSRFFPTGKTLCADVEETMWKNLQDEKTGNPPHVFEDQYISTGGQFYEILAGHDRMLGDIRPLLFSKLGLSKGLTCHPYDACVWPILHEAGAVLESPLGGPISAPLDTTSPVAWIAFANKDLAELARPALRQALRILS